MSEAASKAVHRGIVMTKITNPMYWQHTLAQRAGIGPHAGSYYPNMTQDQVEKMLMEAEWDLYNGPGLAPGTIGYVADLSGMYNMIHLSDLGRDKQVLLSDPKGTGHLYAHLMEEDAIKHEGTPVDYTVLILGPDKGEIVCYTFHPGPPEAPSEVPFSEELQGRLITVRDARKLGFTVAKA